MKIYMLLHWFQANPIIFNFEHFLGPWDHGKGWSTREK